MSGTSGLATASSADPAPFLRAALDFLAADRPREALFAASEACHLAPREAQSHLMYGRALLACDELLQAERAFAEAVRLRPTWPEAWIAYGVVRQRQGALDDAREAMHHALAHAPGHQTAMAHLEALACPPSDAETPTTGTFESGVRCYRAGAYAEAKRIFIRLHAAQGDGADPAILTMLGLAHVRLGEGEPALALLEAAFAASPADPLAEMRYGLALHAVGRHAQAATRFRSSAKSLPRDPAPPLNLSSALLASGDVRGALDAAIVAQRRDPDLPQAHYMLGLAHMAAQNFDEAVTHFQAALQLNPKLADAHVNIGVIAYRRHDIERAKGEMRRALAIDPSHSGAAGNLGAFMRLSGYVEAGEKLLDTVLQHNPDAHEVRINRSAALLSEDRPGEALALLDATPKPGNERLAQHWQLQRSLALMQVGRIAEAREIVAALGDVPPEMAPLILWRRALLAQADGDAEAAKAHALAMEETLATTPGLVPEHRIMAHYDLGRFWNTHRDPDRTFANWIAGHRLLGRYQPFSRDAHRAFVDATISTLDRRRLHGGPRARNRDQAPVFIVGMPRSGTTLAHQILSAHPSVFGAGERGALHRAVFDLGGETPEGVAGIAALDDAALDASAQNYLSRLHAIAPDKARIVDKMPGNFNHLGLAALMLPGARIIHCIRDPRDIGFSIFTYRFYGHHPYAHDLSDLGWYIGQHDRLMAHWREALPLPILTVALKDWVEDFVGTLRRVLEFVALPYDSACERFHESPSRVMTVSRAQVKEPVNARGLGRWRRYAVQLQPLIESLAEAGVVLP